MLTHTAKDENGSRTGFPRQIFGGDARPSKHQGRGLNGPKLRLYAYFGHHKCASTWISGILRQVSVHTGLKFAHLYHPKWSDQDLSQFVREQDVEFLSYVTARKKHVDQLKSFKGFHVIRDPRDICVSAYFSHLYSHGTTGYASHVAEIRRELNGKPKDEGLMMVIKDRREQFEEMSNWDYSSPNILELKMETLIQDPYQGFLEIFQHLGLLDDANMSTRKQVWYVVKAILLRLQRTKARLFPVRMRMEKVPAEKLLGIVYKNRFSKKTGGRTFGQEEISSHYRKGVAGDWVNHFSEEHIQYFKEHYNDVMIKLGYESGNDW